LDCRYALYANVVRNAPMTRIQYIAGLTFIFWGLTLITPLYLQFRLSDAFVVIPIIALLLFTGATIMKGKKFSWTLGLALGIILLLHYVIMVFDEIYKVTDIVRRYKAPEVILFSVWTMLTLSTLYSVSIFLTQEVRTKLNITSSQYRWTLIGSLLLGMLITILLLRELYWI